MVFFFKLTFIYFFAYLKQVMIFFLMLIKGFLEVQVAFATFVKGILSQGAGRSSWCDGSSDRSFMGYFSWHQPIELFLVPAITPRLV